MRFSHPLCPYSPLRTCARFIAMAALAIVLPLALGPAAPASAQGLECYRLVDTWTTRQPQGIAEFGTPAGVDVAPDGTIYVADSGRRIVHKLSSDGLLLDAWDVSPGGDRPFDVATTGDRVFTAAVNDGQILSASGAASGGWAVEGMSGVAVGPDRTLYVARLEPGSFGLQPVIDLRDAGGNLRETWRDNRTFIQQSCGMDVGADGRVYLAADGAIYVWRDGAIEKQLRVSRDIEGNLITDVAVDAQGRIFGVRGGSAAACGGGGVDDRYIVMWENIDAGSGVVTSSVSRQLRGAVALATGPDAGLVVATVDGTTFKGISWLPDRGDLQARFIRWGVIDESLGVLDAPQRVAVTTDGDVIISDRQDVIQRWSDAGRPLEKWEGELISDVAAMDDRPCVLAGRSVSCLLDGGGSAWESMLVDDAWISAIDAGPNRLARVDLGRQQMELLDSNGAAAGSWPLPSDAGFAVFSGVAVDGNRIYLADRSNGLVHVFGLDGTVAQPPIGLPNPAVRLSARDGSLFALTGDGWILKYAADGTPRAAWRPLADGLPSDLAAGPNGRVYVGDPDPTRNRILVFEPGGSPPAAFPEAPDLRCEVRVDKRATPGTVRVAEAVEVTLSIDGACPEGDGRLDVALVVDRSGSMKPEDISAAQNAVVSFLGELEPGAAQVALVAFSSDAEVLTPLTSDLQRVVRGVSGLSASGMTRIDLALQAALAEMTGPGARDDVPRVVVLMTDGQPTTNDEGPTKSAANALKGAGIQLYTIGLGEGIDDGLLRELASSPDLYFQANSELDLVTVYAEVGRLISATELLQSATVVDELPADMRLDESSVVPPATWDAAARTLTWNLAAVPTSGLDLRYTLRPVRVGRRPTNVQARIDWRDASGTSGTLAFPVPEVVVESSLVFLPYVSRNVCRPQRADVVLLIDNSSSMRGAARPGSSETKLDAALSAVRVFLNEMKFPDDQAAIITFDQGVRLDQRLTGTRAALEFALSQVTPGQGTRIDSGLAASFNELIGPRHKAKNERVIILLTDGRPTPGTEVDVIKRAREARAAGIQLFTIALGADADPVLLTLVTNNLSRSFRAPNADQLRDIYTSIAGQVLCD
jgi:Mg-chelatase subunit ChlD/sugar lactone lactonase YvrE